MQLQVMHVTDGDGTLERLARATVDQPGLGTVRRQAELLGDVIWIGQLEHVLDLVFIGTIKDRGGNRHTVFQVLGQLDDLVISQARQIGTGSGHVIDLVQVVANVGNLGCTLFFKHVSNSAAHAVRCPAKVDFKHLTHVHSRRYAQRVQNNIHRGAIRHVRHVFHRRDLGHYTLVPVAAGHLVTGLQATLDGQVNLDHLEYAGRQLVTLGQLLALFLEGDVELVALLLQRFLGMLKNNGMFFVSKTDIEPHPAIGIRQIIQILASDLGTLGQLARTAVDFLANQEFADTVEDVIFDNAQLVIQIQTIAAQFVVNDRLGPLVALNAFTREDLYVDDRADHAGGHAQRRVLDVGRLLAKDGAQQFFFRRKLGFALGRDFSDQNVVGAHFRTDIDNARIVQTVQLGFRQVADIAGDFFLAQLGVARNHGQLFDVNRCVAIVGNHFFRDQDRVLEVVAMPGHEGHQHVLAQGQFAQIRRCAVGQHVTTFDLVPALDDGTLVDVGVLVGPCVLGQVVDVDPDFAGHVFVVVDANDDTLRIDVIDHTATLGLDGGARVHGHGALHPRTDQQLFRKQARASI